MDRFLESLITGLIIGISPPQQYAPMPYAYDPMPSHFRCIVSDMLPVDQVDPTTEVEIVLSDEGSRDGRPLMYVTLFSQKGKVRRRFEQYTNIEHRFGAGSISFRGTSVKRPEKELVGVLTDRGSGYFTYGERGFIDGRAEYQMKARCRPVRQR